jgi:hypothetical protein
MHPNHNPPLSSVVMAFAVFRSANLCSAVVRFCSFPIFSASPRLRDEIPVFSDQPITRDHPITRSFPYHPLIFLPLVANKALPQFDPRASLAPRLGGPWVAQGWPRGHPNPVPSPSRQRVANYPKTQNATESPLRPVLILRIPITKYRSSFSSPF